MTKIWRDIESANIQPVYLVSGLEQHIADETVRKIANAIPDMKAEDILRYDLEETPIQTVLEEADELPFLQEHKLIIAGNCSFLRAADQKKEKQPHNLEMLEQWLESPSPTATVVFMAPYEKLDARKRITKKIRQYAEVIEANKLEGKDLTTWIQQQGSSLGIQVDAEEAAFIVEVAGDDLLLLAAELEKLAAYLSYGGKVTQDLIDQLVPKTPEMDVFRLTDAFVNGRIGESVSVYRDLLRNGEEPIMLTSLIAGQIRLMVHVANLRKKGYQQSQIAGTLSVHPYRVKLMMQRKLPELQKLYEALHQLAKIDLQLKTMSGNRERRLELFLMEGLYAR